MQSQNKLFDDISKLMTNAAGMAQSVRGEAQTAFQSWMDRFVAEQNLVTREEFDAVREMATRAREENDALMRRIEALEAAQGKPGEE